MLSYVSNDNYVIRNYRQDGEKLNIRWRTKDSSNVARIFFSEWQATQNENSRFMDIDSDHSTHDNKKTRKILIHKKTI